MVATRPRMPTAEPAPPLDVEFAPVMETAAEPATGDSPDPDEPATPEGFQGMTSAPRGKRIVLVSETGETKVAQFRFSRFYKKGRWIPHEFWADPTNSYAPILFRPIGWREDKFVSLAK